MRDERTMNERRSFSKRNRTHEGIDMSDSEIIIDGISAATERAILKELEKLGVLVTCETCGMCDLEGARCITTARGNGICGGSLRKID
jgi:hypothetical protein